MKVMFISDLHGSYYWANRAIEKYHEEKADKLIILGDILYHGPRNVYLRIIIVRRLLLY